MTASKLVVLSVVVAVASGCASRRAAGAGETDESSNFDPTFHASGADSETATQNEAALRLYGAPVSSPSDREALGKVKVFTSSIPNELTIKDSVIGIAEGSSAVLVGSVELRILSGWIEDAAVIPAAKKAAHAMDADVAFCPTTQKPAINIWRCFLVKTAKALPVEAANPTRM